MSEKIAGLTEIELVYKFLSDYAGEYASIYKDGSRWAAETSGDKNNGYFNGETISAAILAFYEAQAKAENQ